MLLGCPGVVQGLSEVARGMLSVMLVRRCQGCWTAFDNHQFLKFYWKSILFDVSLQWNWDTWRDTSGIPRIPLGYFWIEFHWKGRSSWAKLGYLWDTSGILLAASDSFWHLPTASNSIWQHALEAPWDSSTLAAGTRPMTLYEAPGRFQKSVGSVKRIPKVSQFRWRGTTLWMKCYSNVSRRYPKCIPPGIQVSLQRNIKKYTFSIKC